MVKRNRFDRPRSKVHRYQDYATAVCLTLEFLPWDSIHRMAEEFQRVRRKGGCVYVLCSDECASTAIHITQIFHQLERKQKSRASFSVAYVTRNNTQEDCAPYECLPRIAESRLIDSLSEKDLLMLVCASDRHDQVSTLNRAQEQHALTVGWIPNSNHTTDSSFDIELRVPNERIDQVEIAFEIIAKILVDDFRYRLSKNELLRR